MYSKLIGILAGGALLAVSHLLPAAAWAQNSVRLDGLEVVQSSDWNESSVRRVLQAFAFGGHASNKQIGRWARLKPEIAVVQMLNFNAVNRRLSAPEPGAAVVQCTSMTELQQLWGSNDPANPVRQSDRSFYSMLNDDLEILSPVGLYLTWPRAMHTRGCNLFLHKVAFYLTNYHASIHVQNAGVGLIRDYYDDTVKALMESSRFEDLMYQAATNGAVAFAYGHFASYVHPFTGEFFGNDDFAREYFQLLFGIEGTMEDPEYHEGVTIENNAKLLTGMMVDAKPGRFNSAAQRDWLLTGIDFSDHFDEAGRQIYNRTAHIDFRKGPFSCLEILHHNICGATASEKLRALGRVAASHPESMANVPLKLVRFFGDTVITPEEAEGLQAAWQDAELDILRFLRGYAVSTQFHTEDSFKYWSAFERNLIMHNAAILDNEESFAKPFFLGPVVPMFEQNALVFAPIRDVFGGQTGNDAANDRFGFRSALNQNVDRPEALGTTEQYYRLAEDSAPKVWRKDWSKVIPANAAGDHVVGDVARWLWQRFIADGGANFDAIAQAQVHALLATGFDFAAVVDRGNIDALYSSEDLEAGFVAEVDRELAATVMNFADPGEQARIGMAVNFITMLPYAFARTGESK
ncbi:MAG: hypothetical protein HKN57_10190 [Xanthomonadales bacterium]|nr:hypothetical protein [Gammaproteobacteria bacterium]MBT8054546.1 hypothetical protein [Gammaproteobacteria bacterium]NND57614.1 hypothetical protein [Xanthomonadales bacterium]NNK51338.1 hypothetical protein [Xanthomonadales bacterium]NNL94221.1 hypothetical protein [Xanthomonadales bacterium]